MAVNAKNWQELKKPNALEKKQSGGDQRRRAAFVAEPLERGFGMTLGNSLRRVLLSSLQGAAITSIKIAAGIVPAVAVAAATAVMLAYPLTEKAFRAVVAELAQRRAAQAISTPAGAPV